MAEKERNQESGREPKEAGPARQRPQQAPTRPMTQNDIEASETDGKGSGGTGADLGGYGPVPGSDTSG